MTIVADQRCINHMHREAVARCPACGRYCCRECITEHEDRVLCAVCLDKKTGVAETGIARFSGLMRTAQFLCGLIVVWFVFYYLGQILLSTPSSFHEGTMWKSVW